ncbi:MAG: hypothetical protein L3J03_08245, partial [Desulfobacterales bacterium]|nr:hypothetical protein [Desulfobacterales bacterium]
MAMAVQGFEEEALAFGVAEYVNQTNLHPLALASLLVLCLLTLVLPRRFALIPSLVLVCFVPSAQRVVIFGLDFNLLRIIAAVGCLRIFIRQEFDRSRWRAPDTVFIGWAVASFF